MSNPRVEPCLRELNYKMQLLQEEAMQPLLPAQVLLAKYQENKMNHDTFKCYKDELGNWSDIRDHQIAESTKILYELYSSLYELERPHIIKLDFMSLNVDEIKIHLKPQQKALTDYHNEIQLLYQEALVQLKQLLIVLSN